MVKTLYIGVNSDLLDKYIRESGLKIGYIVEQLGISRQGFIKKKKGQISFKASEVFTLCDLLNIQDDDKQKIFCP